MRPQPADNVDVLRPNPQTRPPARRVRVRARVRVRVRVKVRGCRFQRCGLVELPRSSLLATPSLTVSSLIDNRDRREDNIRDKIG